jgi:hypothetical protein
MGKAKTGKKRTNQEGGRPTFRMSIVLSDTCEACPTPCPRGIRYRLSMREPGAIGKGVPCILTRTVR